LAKMSMLPVVVTMLSILFIVLAVMFMLCIVLMSMLCLISPPSHWGPRDHQRSSWQWCHYCLICWQWSRCCLLCWQWCQCCLLFWQCWQCCLLCWQWSHLHHIKDPKIIGDPLGNDVHVVYCVSNDGNVVYCVGNDLTSITLRTQRSSEILLAMMSMLLRTKAT
jgi:hypothetical protein